MKNTTEISKLVEDAVNSLIAEGVKRYGGNGFPHALGYTQATLAHVLIELNDINPKAAERFIQRLENIQER